jgi:hypothetical protein
MAFFKTINSKKNGSYEVFSFGKYEGVPVEIIAANYPLYIDWCLDNLEGFSISPYIYMILYKAIKDSFTQALRVRALYKIDSLKKLCRRRFTKEENQRIIDYIRNYVNSPEWENVEGDNKILFKEFSI